MVVKTFKTGKLSGLDGLTTEVLKACWEWVGGTCWEVIKAFQRDGILMPGALRGVIRLIPKGGDGEFLKNWRPITMLTLIYKIISKLVALRIQLVMTKLVDKEQTCVIKGRHILDNILMLKIGKEFVKFKKSRIPLQWQLF